MSAGVVARGDPKTGFVVPFVFYRILVIALTALAVLAPLSLVFYQSFLTGPFFQPSLTFER